MVETTKLKYDKGKGNFQWDSEMHRYKKEHQQ